MPIYQFSHYDSLTLICPIGYANIPIMIKPLEKPISVVDQCTTSLQRAILSGQISPGERLPPERDLAQQWGVNRVSVRTALARLSASGLVSVRQGSGYRVCDYQVVGGTDLIEPLIELAAEDGRLCEAISDLLLSRRIATTAILTHLSAGSHRSVRTPFQDSIRAFEILVEEQAGSSQLANAESQIYIGLVRATQRPLLGVSLNPINRALVNNKLVAKALVKQPSENRMVWRLVEAWLAQPNSLSIAQLDEQLQRRDEQTLRRINSQS